MAIKSILNALGKALYYSGASTHWFSATGAKSGSVLAGTTGNDSMYGDAAVNDTMSGGAGDDIYYLYSAGNHVLESAGGGVDTVNTWMSYTLPDNFENLTVTGSGSYAFGNGLDNIISGASGSQIIDGGAGNDVLSGGGGADTFIMAKGNGSDLITDFSSDDKVRLNQYGFTSFSQVASHFSQHGADLWLDFDNGEKLVFSNKTATDMQAGQFQLGLDRSQLTQTFADNFNTLSLHNGTTGTWDAKFPWAPDKGGNLASNGELEWYVNPLYAPTASLNPFSVSNGVLTISADKTPDAMKSQVGGSGYTSGMLTTYSTFAQTYGYFEIRADMPSEQGAWPAFWLLPEDGSWPPELDVVEMTGQDSHTVQTTVHSDATGQHTKQGMNVQVPSTDGFHTYGVLWKADTITWYMDDVAIYQAATPADMHDPMYMLVDLAVGGIAGTPTDGLPNGADMKIDYIKAYSLNDAPVAASTSLATHSTSHA
ncbi:MAG TPA: family 16 glycosylhydrolase [Dongiaceae bacterium]|nr:family 16 glycosylhydrolase [Dongiaceae bacterium]